MSTQDTPVPAPGSLAGLRGRHFVTDQDYTREELLGLLDLAAALKALYRRRPAHALSRGAHAGDDLRASVDAHAHQLRGRA